MVVKINAIEVGEGRGPELEERFAKRAKEVEGMPGFLGFELLRPAAGETRYFVYTRWETDEHFRAWVDSSAFTRGHAQAAKDSKRSGDEASGRGQSTVAHGSALMEFEVVELVAPSV
jgi:heme-degrading monooxygenase HmoA